MIVDLNTLEACQGGQRGSSTIGEIWVNGPSVASGYWNRPEISKQTFYAKITGEVDKKYLRTGDLGFLSDGQLFVTGRIKDLIIVDGLNHYPQDIELTVEKSLPAIRPGCSAAFFVEIQEHESLVVVAEVAPPHKLAALQEETPGKLSWKQLKIPSA